jgi:hypothetical protein
MTDRPRDETEASEQENEHPLAQPTELAGTAEGAIAAEFAARDAIEAAEEQDNDAG